LVSSQIKFIEMLAKKVVSLNFYQIEYVFKKYTEKEKNKNNISLLSINPHWYELQTKLNNELPKESVRFTNHEELIKNLSGWYSNQNPGFGLGGSAAAPKVEEKKEEKKVEKKEEKREVNLYKLKYFSERSLRYRINFI